MDSMPALTSGEAGLSASQVAAQRRHGYNEIVPATSQGWLAIARDTARDPMLWFLVLASVLFGLLGQLTEALILLVAMVPLLAMDAWLHRRTRASTGGLESRLASTARVLRDGQWAEVAARELVPGDLVAVHPGEYFPADGLLVSGSGLQVDESTLTGEAQPVRKQVLQPTWPLPPRADESCWGMAGTRVLTGTAWLRIACIGATTRYGEIVRCATEGRHEATPLQQAIARLVIVLLGGVLVLCVLLAGIRLWHGHGWIDAVLSAVTLAVAALPEEFPIVYTFFLGVGVFRLARRKALVRRAVAVENIGRTTCIVSDKTGTITAGALVLAHSEPAEGHDVPWLVQAAARAARQDSDDPLDQALHAAAGALPTATRLAAFPFLEARRRETIVWQVADGPPTAFTKGAPETVMNLCSLSEADRQRWAECVDRHARSGHKVIACAWRELADGMAVSVEPDQGFRWAGLLAFEDPVREGVGEAVAQCMASGMRLIMVTGDHPATAAAIAQEIGLGGGKPQVLVLAPEDDAAGAIREHRSVHVVARATPMQKLALVQALQAEGELVAVTGDGVNDVPALRLADVGVAMGERGTRSAREVAPVVLLDDNFRTLVAAVAEGRQLFQNLRLAFTYLLLVHLPLVVGAAVIPLMGLPLLFLPIHIVWLELIIHPTAMLAFQDLPAAGPLAPVERTGRRVRFHSPAAWAWIGATGLLLSLAVVSSYLHALGADQDVLHARAMAMTMLLVASAAITAGLAGLRRATVRGLVVTTLASTAVLVQWPAASALLSLRPLHTADWALVVLAFVGVLAVTRVIARATQAPAGRRRA